jgi:hypothetical protein
LSLFCWLICGALIDYPDISGEFVHIPGYVRPPSAHDSYLSTEISIDRYVCVKIPVYFRHQSDRL